MADKLFVYGTLHPAVAPAEIVDVVAKLQSLGKGSVRGVRHDLGLYPGLKRGRKTRGDVQGEVFALPDDRSTLAQLDEYEGFDPANPKASLFKRMRVKATLQDGKKTLCWVYFYNRRIPSAHAQPEEDSSRKNRPL